MSAAPDAPPPPGRFSLDTNVLVDFVDAGAGERHARARAILERARLRDCVLAAQSLGEFYAASTRKRLATPARAAAIARDWMALFPVVVPDPADVGTALAAAEAGRFSYWDALLLATLGRAGCKALLSEDMADGAALAGVTVLDPFAGEGDAPPPAVVRLLGG